ncbi:hypothetical protein [Anaerobacterium chartisolvens]|nr:hypothetical protein [Anaerobacterium chartisolvens]
MDETIKIGFVGSKTEDIILYISRILFNMDMNIAVMDTSEQQLLKYSVPESIPINLLTSYRNVDFYIGCCNKENYKKVDISKYNVIIINFGLNPAFVKELMSCSLRFAVTDLERSSVLRLKEYLEMLDCSYEFIRIYRDVVDSKIDKSYLDSLLDIATVVKEYYFYISEKELCCRLDSQYNDIFRFSGLPKEYSAMFKDILVDSLSFNRKDVEMAIKKAEKGK